MATKMLIIVKVWRDIETQIELIWVNSKEEERRKKID